MNIFGSLGGLLGGLIEKYGGAEAAAGQVLTQMGGVEGVVDKLRQAGFGNQVSSWLGAGPNEPVTADGIAKALGHGPLATVAQRIGISPDELSETLAQVLPGLVDRLSPNGRLQPHLADEGAADGADPLAPPS